MRSDERGEKKTGFMVAANKKQDLAHTQLSGSDFPFHIEGIMRPGVVACGSARLLLYRLKWTSRQTQMLISYKIFGTVWGQPRWPVGYRPVRCLDSFVRFMTWSSDLDVARVPCLRKTYSTVPPEWGTVGNSVEHWPPAWGVPEQWAQLQGKI